MVDKDLILALVGRHLKITINKYEVDWHGRWTTEETRTIEGTLESLVDIYLHVRQHEFILHQEPDILIKSEDLPEIRAIIGDPGETHLNRIEKKLDRIISHLGIDGR